MAEFEAKVYKLTIEEHPNADRLELARVGDYRSIVQKGQFKTGDLGVYIPEAAVLPEWLIEELGLEGRLAGKQKNRVKAVKLRKVLSQGLVYPVVDGQIKFITTDKDYLDESELQTTGEGIRYAGVQEGDDVTEYLGIIKYEPPIPIHMAGEVENAFGKTIKYDIENWKKYPNVIEDGEDIVFPVQVLSTFSKQRSST